MNQKDKSRIYLEDFSVLGEHIISLHTGLSWESTNKNGDIDVSEGFSLVAGSSDGLQAREGAILNGKLPQNLLLSTSCYVTI